MNAPRPPMKPAALALVVGLVLVLAACGGPPEAVQSPAASPTTAMTAPVATTAASPATTTAGEPAATVTTATVREPTAEPTALPATAPAAAPATSTGGKILRVHQRAYPDIMDPQKLSFTNEIVMVAANYEALTRLDKDLKSVPAAAERWEFNASGDEITFTLRDGLTYSDRTPLTSENFRYAIQRTCDPQTAGQYQGILFDIVGCADFASTPVTDTVKYEAARQALGAEAPDERTLRVKLTHPAPYFPYVAGLWVMYPARQDLIEAGGETWWEQAQYQIGNGPFQIAEIQEGQRILLTANERYWAGRPKLDGLEYIYQEDPSIALEAYKAGQIDIMHPDPADVPAVQGDPVLSKELVRYPAAATQQVQFNLVRKPFDDPKVREAFAYAFDRATYCEAIMSGTCVPTLSWIPEGVPGAIETEQFAFDPAKAQAALAASSYGGPDTLPEITYTYSSSNPAEQPRAEWIAGQYRDVLGVDIKLEGVDIKTLISYMKENATYPQMTQGGWIQDYPDPQNWLSVFWLSSSTFAKNMAYKNPQFDELVQQADVELDAEERIKLYQQAGQILVDDQPGVFIYNSAVTVLVKPNVTGYDITASDFEWPGQWASLLTVDITP